MTTLKSCVSSCRYCRYYTPQGLRGGTCGLLNVSVKSEWKACSLSAPSFGYRNQQEAEKLVLVTAKA
ncbi:MULTISPECIES: hypothetical protein [Nostocales]|uniref:Uncharacterized protein n=3 Tax=Nostocales TaxID=1161 RepID=A0A8S9SW93_9CYAN|nr:hypothetical protein [Tolypothrix bouteillei]KAF3884037.1 hypothetical protein DA73_0400002250 [Tolypothrix bouteillei VB521301]